MKPRILNLTNHPVFPINFGGARVVHGFLRGLAARKHDVTLLSWRVDGLPSEAELGYRFVSITPENPHRAEFSPFSVSRAMNHLQRRLHDPIAEKVRQRNPKLWKKYWDVRWQVTSSVVSRFLFLRAFYVIRKEKVDTLIIDYPFLGLSGWVASRLSGVQLVIHSHNIESQRLRSMGDPHWRWLHLYEGWVYRQADKVLFISEQDAEFAEKNMGVPRSKIVVCPYGADVRRLKISRAHARKVIGRELGILPQEKIVLYFGRLDYGPNIQGLEVLCKKLAPLLAKQIQGKYRIVVCGFGMPENFKQEKLFTSGLAIYAGCVPQIDLYLRGADVVINPILCGGGIKTKVVEALAQDCTVVATDAGAVGVDRSVCGKKLRVVADQDWLTFAKTVAEALRTRTRTPEQFFSKYSQSRVLRRVEKHFTKRRK